MEQESQLAGTIFDIRWERGRGIGVIEARGDIDLATIPAFKAALTEVASAEEGVVINLTRVTYMDSSGFSTLLEVNRILRPLGLPMFLVGPNPNILRMLEITRLNSIFAMEESVEDALKTLDGVAAVVVAA